MKSLFPFCIILFSLLLCVNCGCFSAKRSTQREKFVVPVLEESRLDLRKYKILPIKSNETFTLESDWDLMGDIYMLPEGVTLNGKGGVFKNGTLIGNHTRIKTKEPLFHKVSIMGEWNVPEITTRMFVNLDYNNSLRDVLALSHPKIMNKVVIEGGKYSVSADSFQSALNISSNVELIINGSIHLVPNDYKGCYVLTIQDAKNVTITGMGCIYGDKHTHKGKEGEWGHGICILGSENITIQDINVRDCWGDCIYVGNSSKNVIIKNSKLDHGRRQGISVTSADRVIIEDCVISNVSGTEPQAAIDIEPNHNENIDNIMIRNVQCRNCYGGIEAWRPEDARIGSLSIEGCSVINSHKRWSIIVRYAEEASVENCIVDSGKHIAIMAVQVENITIKNNKVYSTSESPITISKCKKSDVRVNEVCKSKF